MRESEGEDREVVDHDVTETLAVKHAPILIQLLHQFISARELGCALNRINSSTVTLKSFVPSVLLLLFIIILFIIIISLLLLLLSLLVYCCCYYYYYCKFGHSCVRVMKSRLYDSRVRDHVVHLGINVNSFAHGCGCVVDGGNAMAAI